MPRKPGRVPKSADVIELTGNRSRLSKAEIDARRAAEVKARPLRTTAPSDLAPLERECWEAHAPELERLGLLTVLDSGAFRFACTSYMVARSAIEQMRPTKADGTPDARRKGVVVTDTDRVHGGMLKRHPAVLTYFAAVRDYRAWCVEFGLTPSSRIGLRPAAGAPAGARAEREDDDDFDFG